MRVKSRPNDGHAALGSPRSDACREGGARAVEHMVSRLVDLHLVEGVDVRVADRARCARRSDRDE
jgi:hypothetical protein